MSFHSCARPCGFDSLWVIFSCFLIFIIVLNCPGCLKSTAFAAHFVAGWYEYEHELPYQKAEGRTDLQEALSEGAAPECVAFAPADCASNCKFHLCDVSLTFLGRNWAELSWNPNHKEDTGEAWWCLGEETVCIEMQATYNYFTRLFWHRYCNVKLFHDVSYVQRRTV